MSSDDQAVCSDKDATDSRPGSGSIADSAGKRKKGTRRIKREWEIVEGLRDGQRFEEKPVKFDGYLSKRRNPPLKGWHKRYFVLDEGALVYSKSPYNLQKGKIHGTIDVGVSVLTINRKSRKIDLDNGEFVCHLKAKSPEWFNEWLEHLRRHRLYRQNELSYGTRAAPLLFEMVTADSLPTEPSKPSLSADATGTSISQLRQQPPTDAGGGRAAIADTSVPTIPVIVTSAAAQCAGRARADEKRRHYSVLREGSLLRSNSLLASQGKVIAWLIDASGNEQYSRDLGTAEQTLEELYTLMRQLSIHGASADCSAPSDEGQKKGGGSGLMRKLSFKSGNKSPRGKSPGRELSSSTSGSASPRLARSQLALKDYGSDGYLSDGGNAAADGSRASSADSPSAKTDFGSCAEVFLSKSKEVLDMLKNLARRLNTERERLKALVDKDQSTMSMADVMAAAGGGCSSGDDVCCELRLKLAALAKQNAELRTRLGLDPGVGAATSAAASGAADEMLQADELAKAAAVRQPSLPLTHSPPLHGDLAKAGSLESHTSASDYYDAMEYGDVSSEASESETSTSSTERDERDADVEAPEDATAADEIDGVVMSMAQRKALAAKCHTGRRSKLPAPKMPGGDVGLVQLLTRNIGKDLTRISMPVTLNEPLSMLQLLCEELEYAELLDKASSMRDPHERMVYVAAFAASCYSASVKRAGTKPFNPVLGETYECLRDDLGWKFVAEQVSHHPPVSACHAESNNFVFWQDVRIKTRFWGKSMEFHPSGTVNVILKKYNEHYQWNKVTTCLHNILGGQRWVDQYGDMLIKNVAQGITCKLTFVKASYWSDKKHEVNGMVCTSDGAVVSYLHGRWTEGLYTGTEAAARCIWRPGSFPEDNDLYYGFTRFAIELNELLPGEAAHLPPTDSRLRPDQRLLEEGRIPEAESEKLRVEKVQRDTKKRRDELGKPYEPRWFRRLTANGQDHYQYNNEYWRLRENPGFRCMTFDPLW